MRLGANDFSVSRVIVCSFFLSLCSLVVLDKFVFIVFFCFPRRKCSSRVRFIFRLVTVCVRAHLHRTRQIKGAFLFFDTDFCNDLDVLCVAISTQVNLWCTIFYQMLYESHSRGLFEPFNHKKWLSNAKYCSYISVKQLLISESDFITKRFDMK